MKLDSKYFDRIRIRSRNPEPEARAEVPACGWEGCDQPGLYKAPKGHRFEGEYRGKKREWKRIERPYREGIPKQPQQHKGGLDDHEIDRPDEPAYLVRNAVKRRQFSLVVFLQL